MHPSGWVLFPKIANANYLVSLPSSLHRYVNTNPVPTSIYALHPCPVKTAGTRNYQISIVTQLHTAYSDQLGHGIEPCCVEISICQDYM